MNRPGFVEAPDLARIELCHVEGRSKYPPPRRRVVDKVLGSIAECLLRTETVSAAAQAANSARRSARASTPTCTQIQCGRRVSADRSVVASRPDAGDCFHDSLTCGDAATCGVTCDFRSRQFRMFPVISRPRAGLSRDRAATALRSRSHVTPVRSCYLNEAPVPLCAGLRLRSFVARPLAGSRCGVSGGSQWSCPHLGRFAACLGNCG
jgi:hypothetical protein